MKILSIHIQKTAGSAFYDWLCHQFNDVSVNMKRELVQQEAFTGLLHHEVVHGHIKYREVNRFLNGDEKILTWVRHPVDRVISNYRFFKSTLEDPLRRNPVVFQKNKHRLNETLAEYIERPETQNMMSDFLQGVDLEQLYFIGVFEQFNSDLERLAKKLKTSKTYIPPRINESSKKNRPEIKAEERKKIEQLNAKDVELYQQVIALNQNRL